MKSPSNARGSSRAACALLAGFALALCPALAFAQSTDDLALRRITLDRARTASEAGRLEEALELAQRALEIQSTPSVRMFLAVQQVALRRYADASLSAQGCVYEAEAAPQLANREAILEECRRIVVTSRGFTGSLLLRLPAPAPAGMVVRVNGVARTGAQLRLPVPVDAGTVAVEAVADGGLSFRSEVRVTVAETVPVVVEFGAPTIAASPVRPPEPAPARTGIGAGPVVLLVAGGAAGVASLALFIARNSSVSDCAPGMEGRELTLDCPARTPGEDRRGTPVALETASAVSLGVGVAALVAGGVWLGLRVAGSGRASEERAAVTVVPDATGLRIVGRF